MIIIIFVWRSTKPSRISVYTKRKQLRRKIEMHRQVALWSACSPSAKSPNDSAWYEIRQKTRCVIILFTAQCAVLGWWCSLVLSRLVVTRFTKLSWNSGTSVSEWGIFFFDIRMCFDKNYFHCWFLLLLFPLLLLLSFGTSVIIIIISLVCVCV